MTILWMDECFELGAKGIVTKIRSSFLTSRPSCLATMTSIHWYFLYCWLNGRTVTVPRFTIRTEGGSTTVSDTGTDEREARRPSRRSTISSEEFFVVFDQVEGPDRDRAAGPFGLRANGRVTIEVNRLVSARLATRGETKPVRGMFRYLGRASSLGSSLSDLTISACTEGDPIGSLSRLVSEAVPERSVRRRSSKTSRSPPCPRDRFGCSLWSYARSSTRWG